MAKLKLYSGIYLLLMVLAAGIYFYFAQHGQDTVEIMQDGEVLQTIDLSKVNEPYQFKVEYQGHYNIMLVAHNEISIVDADCPDKLCVQMGVLKHDAPPIVCLPNHLVIQYAGNSGVDAEAK